jgi:hypothetical protein
MALVVSLTSIVELAFSGAYGWYVIYADTGGLSTVLFILAKW